MNINVIRCIELIRSNQIELGICVVNQYRRRLLGAASGVGGHVGNSLAIMTSAYGLPSAPPEFWMAGDFCTLPTRLIRQSGLDSLAQIMLHSAEKKW